MSLNISLNQKQQQAVVHNTGPLLVIAGAGSGKTSVITEKIAWLINKQKIPAKKIFAVTFTNKAAKEMQDRLKHRLDNVDQITIATFHKLGLEIMYSSLQTLGLKEGFSIFDTKDCEKIIQDISDTLLDKDSLNEVRNQISAFKNLNANNKNVKFNDTFYKIVKKYQEMLQLYNAVDFDDLLSKPLQLLQNNPEILSQWQQKIGYLLVDEYQDTNKVQYELIKLLTQKTNALTVVGDDDQSIYAWRGARQDNLLKLQNDFPQLTVIKLEQNYRSVGRILKIANSLIANNEHLFEKKLWSALGFGDRARIINCKNANHEAEKIIADLLYQKLIRSCHYEQFAILYRSNHQARLFEQALLTKNVPYKLTGGRSFFDYTEIKDILAYCRILINPDDNAAFLRVVGTPKKGIGSVSLNKIAKLNYLSLFESANNITSHELSGAAYVKLKEFMDWLLKMQFYAETMDPLEILQVLLSDINYQTYIDNISDTEEIAKRRWQNIADLLGWIKNIQNKKDNCLLKDVVQHMSLMDILDKQKDDKAMGVNLMTLHAAKGLEFDFVYMVGMEEDILPHKNSIQDSLDEERRLAYVGITRAKQTLTMSMAKNRQFYGEIVRCTPSRFIKELPKEDLDYSGEGIVADENEQKQIAKTHLANLKAQFGR